MKSKICIQDIEVNMTDAQWIYIEKEFERISRRRRSGMLCIQPILKRGTIKVSVLTPAFSKRLQNYIRRAGGAKAL